MSNQRENKTKGTKPVLCILLQVGNPKSLQNNKTIQVRSSRNTDTIAEIIKLSQKQKNCLRHQEKFNVYITNEFMSSAANESPLKINTFINGGWY